MCKHQAPTPVKLGSFGLGISFDAPDPSGEALPPAWPGAVADQRVDRRTERLAGAAAEADDVPRYRRRVKRSVETAELRQTWYRKGCLELSIASQKGSNLS